MGQGRTLVSPWSAKGEVPTGVNLNRYATLGSHTPWYFENEQNSRKLIFSMIQAILWSSRCVVAPDDAPSSIRLDHGDPVMNGLAQLSCLGCRVFELTSRSVG